MKQNLISWALVFWFMTLLIVHMIVTPGFVGNALIKFIPIMSDFHIILLEYLYKPYIF